MGDETEADIVCFRGHVYVGGPAIGVVPSFFSVETEEEALTQSSGV
jgi:hypothetical protein